MKANFAILDVKAGRKQLARHFAKRPRIGLCPPKMRIPVVITGYIEGVHGSDDGVSCEFGVVVERIERKAGA